MNIRQPLRAGSFYEASSDSCRHHANKLMGAMGAAGTVDNLPARLYGGLVPHAGWTFSGKLAAGTFKLLDANRPLGTVVLLGADHTGQAVGGEVYDSGVWRTPLGDVAVDGDLAAELIAADPAVRANPGAHIYEHSIEVQIPLLQVVRHDVKIVPIMVAPGPDAVRLGRAIGQALAEKAPDARVVASSDLTHHGGHFGSPGGDGADGVRWSVKNDRRLLDLIEKMDAEAIIPEVVARGNACGPGAIAAAIAACREMGATRGVCVEYTNSYEVMRAMYGQSRDYTTVGYACVVFG